MPTELIRVEGRIREGKPYWSVHHLKLPGPISGRTDVQQSDFDGTGGAEIDYDVYDLSSSTPTSTVATGTYDKTAVIFDTLQTDDWWEGEDEDGYNFRGKHEPTDFPNGASYYKVEYEASIAGNDATFGDLGWEEWVTVEERFDA